MPPATWRASCGWCPSTPRPRASARPRAPARSASRERAQDELHGVSERHLAELDAVFEGAPLALAFVDRSGCVLRVNEEVAALAGRSVAALVGRPIRQALPVSADHVQHVLGTGE